MDQAKSKKDTEVLSRFRKEIDLLVDKYCINQPLENRIRLRQLPWQSVDILASTDDIARLKSNNNFKRLVRDVKQIGASDKFIEISVNLAIKIYKTLKTEYPSLLKRYKS